jgi:hypothetical protein
MASAHAGWIASIASALSAASRWLSAGSLTLTLCALAILATRPQAGAGAPLALALVAGLGAAQTYLAVRIEFDRAIFEAAAARPGGFAGFDEALQKLGWSRRASSDRPPEARAAGLGSLVKWSGALLGAQFALLLAALWLLR